MSAAANQYTIRCNACGVLLHCNPLQFAEEPQNDPAIEELMQKLHRHLEKNHQPEYRTVMAFAILTNFEVQDPVLLATKEALKGIVRPFINV